MKHREPAHLLLWMIYVAASAFAPSDAHADAAKRHFAKAEAAQIGATLFPEYCGVSGNRCGYGFVSYGEQRGVCPFDLWISMPGKARVDGWPKTIWIGLDHRKRPVALASHPKHGENACARLAGSA